MGHCTRTPREQHAHTLQSTTHARTDTHARTHAHVHEHLRTEHARSRNAHAHVHSIRRVSHSPHIIHQATARHSRAHQTPNTEHACPSYTRTHTRAHPPPPSHHRVDGGLHLSCGKCNHCEKSISDIKFIFTRS